MTLPLPYVVSNPQVQANFDALAAVSGNQRNVSAAGQFRIVGTEGVTSGSFSNANNPVTVHGRADLTQPMQYTVTPQYDCYWFVGGEVIGRVLDAAWFRYNVGLKISPADADGVTWLTDGIMHHSGASDWNHARPHGLFRLNAGTTYTVTMQFDGSTGGTWQYYRGGGPNQGHTFLYSPGFYLTSSLPATPISAYDDSGWIDLALTSPWIQYDATSNFRAQYRKRAGIVYIRGLVRNTVAYSYGGAGSNLEIATLPVGYRPIGTLMGEGYESDANGTELILRLDLQSTDGKLKIILAGDWSISGTGNSGTAGWLKLTFPPYIADA